jgi:hypothetical protein
MYPIILEYDNAIDSDDLEVMLDIASNGPEAQWAEMNDIVETGEFWLNKRMLIHNHILPSWHQKITELRSEIDFSNITEPRKIQRFGPKDVLGPLADAEHVPSIKYGTILFLNEPAGAEIYFPNLNYKVSAKSNKLVVYPSNEPYRISGPSKGKYLYFSTVFLSLE